MTTRHLVAGILTTMISMVMPFAKAQDVRSNACNNNRPLPYPEEALKLGEAGISLIGFLVRADGTVDRSLVLSSSGSQELDLAVRPGLSKCLFEPAKLGTRCERGAGVDADAVQARQWYEKAASNGDEFALQRLRLGELVTSEP